MSSSARAVSVVEAFGAQAEHRAEQLCLRFEGADLSYGQLWQRARLVAGALRSWGLQPGDRAALFLGNSPTFVALYLGVQLAGGIVVLVNTQYRQTELRHILGDAGVRLCFTDAERAGELDRVRAELPALEAVIVADLELEPLLAAAAPFARLPAADEIALIAYTSGTTGRSKGAMLRHRNLLANIRAVCAAWEWTAADHLLLALPLFHAHGLMVGLHGTIVSGARATLHRQFDARAVYDALLSGVATMFFGVPTMYSRLLREAASRAERPAPIRLYVSGSAPLSPQTFTEWAAVFGQPILERYGMTETIMNTTNPYRGERRAGTVGMPFPGQEARVVDLKTRQPLPPDTVGEIEVRGPHVFAGYWQRPDATAASLSAEGWFRTGDLGSFSVDGYLTISGRARELIISGGYNVYPREVEEVLLGCPGVAEVAVIGLPDPDLGEQVVACVVAADPALTADALIAWCRDQLAAYKKPRRVVFVATLPRNAMGKIEKHTLRAGLAGSANNANSANGPIDH